MAGALSVAITTSLLGEAVRWQRASYPWPTISVRRLHAERPHWFDFDALYAPPDGPEAAP